MVTQRHRDEESAARPWDELSAVDRAVLLEGVRQRREAAEQRRALLTGLQALRHDR